ncbi:MAG: isoleucine--tRNA ligase [Firmicutes bacterium]|nr:isoleucine--tRNA ligase [Bacillota bacterium]
MASKSDYQSTLQLPKTDFPMRANLPKREPEMLKAWEQNQYYQRLQQQRRAAGRPAFVLHDGPPYANGDIHIGTALNKVLKDIVVRSHSMDGFHAPYVPGWDTHGLPIELQALRELGSKRESMTTVEFREYCKNYALNQMNRQRDQFKRLGVWGEWDNPYLTLRPEYEARQIEIFGEMVKRGYVYKAHKPVYWCADCQTALAEAEIEYHDHRSPSIYVRFAVSDPKMILNGLDAYFVIWTTTPWTIPANLAIAVHPDFTYVVVQTEKGNLVVARELLDSFLQEVGLERQAILKEMRGVELEGLVCKHPLYDRDSLVIVGDHVTLDAGTGCVHTAPGHGQEDYVVGLRYNLPAFSPVDDSGRFTAEAKQYAGLTLTEGNSAVVKDLEAAGALLKVSTIDHSYPHCWRCHNPIVYRATEQWFVSIDKFRQQMLDAIQRVKWIPGWGIDRITGMVADRSDWCISRQRVWGVPIPVFYCGCGETIADPETINHVAEVFRAEGSNAWYAKDAAELLPAGYSCPRCGGTNFRKETDIMDVWFDSGVSHAAVLEQWDGLHWPADLYLEGSDQHRGWFQSSLSTAIAALDQAPYRAVLTHGFVVDGDGRKMSKSLGNVIDPAEVWEKYGADVLRMWVASAEYRGDVRISEDILGQLSEAYRRIRNTARFLLGNVSDFNPASDWVPYQDMEELDRWALLRLARLSDRVRSAYRSYDYHLVYHNVHHFCAVDLGGFYLDVLKDRLYCDAQSSHERRSAQTALCIILKELTQLIAPVLVFTADEIWSHLPAGLRSEDSVHLTVWEDLPAEYRDSALESKWEELLKARRVAAKALEIARGEKLIGSSNEASLVIYSSDEVLRTLQELEAELPMLFIVSTVDLKPWADRPDAGVHVDSEAEIAVHVVKAGGEKCDRCWRFSDTVGQSHDYPDLCQRCHTVVNQ